MTTIRRFLNFGQKPKYDQRKILFTLEKTNLDKACAKFWIKYLSHELNIILNNYKKSVLTLKYSFVGFQVRYYQIIFTVE